MLVRKTEGFSPFELPLDDKKITSYAECFLDEDEALRTLGFKFIHTKHAALLWERFC